MKIYNTRQGILATDDDTTFHPLLLSDWDELVTHPDLRTLVHDSLRTSRISARTPIPAPTPDQLLPPIGTQEVWAAGVTYFRSRSARIEESKDAGGGTFYDRVYNAERPELFFKATARRVVGPHAQVRIRKDATWSVPEPELTLLLNPAGDILGYTVGNDMSSRDIEGENPLYLPQAKVYDGSCALGPCLLLTPAPLPPTTPIRINITRSNQPAFRGETTLAELKRDPKELAHYLFRDSSFPTGAYLLTGTGIVPPDDFTLASDDTIAITIDPIGTLTNTVA